MQVTPATRLVLIGRGLEEADLSTLLRACGMAEARESVRSHRACAEEAARAAEEAEEGAAGGTRAEEGEPAESAEKVMTAADPVHVMSGMALRQLRADCEELRRRIRQSDKLELLGADAAADTDSLASPLCVHFRLSARCSIRSSIRAQWVWRWMACMPRASRASRTRYAPFSPRVRRIFQLDVLYFGLFDVLGQAERSGKSAARLSLEHGIDMDKAQLIFARRVNGATLPLLLATVSVATPRHAGSDIHCVVSPAGLAVAAVWARLHELATAVLQKAFRPIPACRCD